MNRDKPFWADAADGAGDPRLYAAATQRNREPILEILTRILPRRGTVLEIASGTGEHAIWFARHLRPLIWQPSDPDPAMRRSIAAHRADAHCPTLAVPLELDVTAPDWPIAEAAAIVCINMVHIAPWAASEGLMAGAARLLKSGAPLYLYGPYKRGGKHTAPSNDAFDRSLRSQNPDWGLRDEEAVAALAKRSGFDHLETVEMPANNLSVIFRRR